MNYGTEQVIDIAKLHTNSRQMYFVFEDVNVSAAHAHVG